ncbi:MAG: DoxX family protein [Calditrichaeota bacterium]|nr:MAG: DoxX family protein [Calditrichota bacterium]
MSSVLLLGRILFSLIFIFSGLNHIFNLKAMTQYAASMGVPAAAVLVPLSGLWILVGGAFVLLGYKAKLGGWMLFIFLILAALFMHRFWGVDDPMMAQNQMIHFMKNMSMAGAALMITYFGSGPHSLEKGEGE